MKGGLLKHSVMELTLIALTVKPVFKKQVFFKSDWPVSCRQKRTATLVFLCARRPCGRPGSRHTQNGF